MIIEISAGAVIVNNTSVAIVYQKSTQTWALPKGHVEGDDSFKQTARREVEEETGITDLTYIKELGTYRRWTKKDPNITKEITVLHFTTTQDKLKPIDPENPIAKWIPIGKVADHLSYQEDKDFFLKIKDTLQIV